MFSARNKYPNFRRARSEAQNKLGQAAFSLLATAVAISAFGLFFVATGPAREAVSMGEAFPPAAAPTNRFDCTVIGVHDGDGPIHCAEGPKIRLHAIAAREIDESCRRGHPCPNATGATAKEALQRLAFGKILTCEATGTSYGRVTALCWNSNGVELNCAMVRGGYALRWDKFDRQRRICE